MIRPFMNFAEKFQFIIVSAHSHSMLTPTCMGLQLLTKSASLLA